MPLLALSANARLIVPVGAIDSRCELRSPWARILSFSGCGSLDAKLPTGPPGRCGDFVRPARYRSVLNSGKAPRSTARSLLASYAASRITIAMRSEEHTSELQSPKEL